MADLHDHFGSQVIEGAAVSSPLMVVDVGPSEVSNFNMAVSVEEDVFRLDISMNYWRVSCV